MRLCRDRRRAVDQPDASPGVEERRLGGGWPQLAVLSGQCDVIHQRPASEVSLGALPSLPHCRSRHGVPDPKRTHSPRSQRCRATHPIDSGPTGGEVLKNSNTSGTRQTDQSPQGDANHVVRGWRPDIQGLRAVAVLMVVAFHAGLPVPGGFSGVDVFFVISGFVIAGVFLRSHAERGRIRLGSFYRRRFRRLTPALALLVTAVVILSGLLQSPFGEQTTTARTGIGAMLLAANVVIGRSTGYFDVAAERNPLLNTWSLSVEEQFYLLLPILLALAYVLMKRWLGPLTIAWCVTSFVTVASLLLAIFGPTSQPLSSLASIPSFFSPLTRAWEFGVGVLVALALSNRRGPTKARGLLATMGLALLGVAAFALSESTPFPGPWTLVPVIGTALLIVSGTENGRGSRISRVLASPSFSYVGDRSYSIYLWHWPIIVFAAGIWGISVVVGAAAAVVSVLPVA